MSRRWGDVLAGTRHGYDPRARYVCEICGATWTWEALVAWDETLGKYICARHREGGSGAENQALRLHDTGEARAPTTPIEREPVVNDAQEGVLVPRPAWEAAMAQLGNVHQAGRELAEARERAARAETEVAFLKERLRELRKREAEEREAMEAAADDVAQTDVARLTREGEGFQYLRGRIRRFWRGRT